MLRFPIGIAAISACFLIAVSPCLRAQDITLHISGGALPHLAVPDLRGSGDAQQFMSVLNQTLWDDLNGSGMLKLVAKTLYPTAIPQQPSDLLQGATGQSSAMAAWSGPPVSADYLAFGYSAVQNGVFVLYGWMFDVRRDTPATAQSIGNRYAVAVSEAGAKKAAHEFAADIISMFGGQPLFDTHIYFTSDRTGHKEIWAMDADGSNQRQITRFNFIAQFPALSPDGSKIAFTAWPGPGQAPRIYIYATDPVRDLRFYNQKSPVNGTPSFTPDGRQIVYMSKPGAASKIFAANLDGSGFRPITSGDQDDAEPKVNPKTGSEIVFSSGRSGALQIYRANMDGLDVQRLTDGTGVASNPSWHPNGQMIAFAWTQGYEPGHFNIFIMDIAARTYVQLTRGEGKNEDPNWSPDGTHIVFGSNRGGSYQIWRMLADGSQVQQLTTAGNNTNPVWGK
jgi:TolB protein